MSKVATWLFGFVVLSFSLYAQLSRGTITGVLTDSTGAVIPAARVSVRNVSNGATYQSTTNSNGQFTVPNLPPGPYEAVFEAPSFKRLVRSGIELGATEVARVDASMELGAVTESVQVSADAEKLQTETPEVGTSLTNHELIDLPLSFGGARLAENFAYKVSPGVSGSSWTSNINGSTNYSKETLLDGATVTTYLSGHFGESSVSVEAIQQFKIQTSGMSAEFGRTQAGVFNYVMKSGANEIHGSAFGELRNEALDANSFVNNSRALPRALDRKQNYAFSFGGPVTIPKVYHGKNKSFFYTSYERYRERTGGFGAPNKTAPLPEFYDGNFSRLLGPSTGQQDAMGRDVVRGAIYDPNTFHQVASGRWVGDMFPGNMIPVSRFSKVSQNLNGIAKKSYLPTVRDASGLIPLVNNTSFPIAGTPEFDQYQFSVKGDQIINSKQKVSGSSSYNARPRLLLDQGGLWDASDPEGGPLSKARRQRVASVLARLAHDYTISPTLLNNFTLFYNRMGNPNIGVHKGIDGSKTLGIGNLDTYGFPAINWGGGPFVTLDNPGDPQNDYQVYTGFGLLDSVSFSKGRHFMKAGYDYRQNRFDGRPTQGGSFNFNARATAIPNEAFAGNLTGYAFASYLLGIVDSAGLSDPVGLGGRRYYHALFFQDDFKVGKRLTLNLGVRWEYQPPFQEMHSRISSWNPNKVDPATGMKGAYDFAGNCSVCTGQNYFGSVSYRDFGPRIGFAYRPFEKWTVRGSYGIFYEADSFNGFSGTPLGKATNVQAGGTWQLSADPVNPWAGIFNWDGGLPLNRFVPSSYDVSWGDKNRPGMIDPKYGRTPYIQQWNINLQHELVKNLILDVGYIGNKSTGLRNGQLQLVDQLPVSALSQFGRALNNAVTTPAQAAANGIAYPYAGFQGTVASAIRPYPQVQGNQTVSVYGSPLGFSTYNALEVVLDKRFSHGLTMYANYVWSKTLANETSSMVNDNGGRPLDYYNLKLEKSVSANDVPHMFKTYVDYQLPFGKGRTFLNTGRLYNAIFGGWSISTVLNYFSGTPIGVGGSGALSGGWNGAGNRANIASGVPLEVSGFDKAAFQIVNTNLPSNTYLNKSAFTDPAPLTLGNSAFRLTQVRNFGTISEDLGLQTNHTFKDKYRFQLRAEALNMFNRHQLGGINTSITSPAFGQVTSVSGFRVVQVGTRFDF